MLVIRIYLSSKKCFTYKGNFSLGWTSGQQRIREHAGSLHQIYQVSTDHPKGLDNFYKATHYEQKLHYF